MKRVLDAVQNVPKLTAMSTGSADQIFDSLVIDKPLPSQRVHDEDTREIIVPEDTSFELDSVDEDADCNTVLKRNNKKRPTITESKSMTKRRRKQCMYENCKNKTCSGGYNRIHCYARRRDNPDLRDIIIEKHCKYCKSLGLAGNDCKGRGGIQYCPLLKYKYPDADEDADCNTVLKRNNKKRPTITESKSMTKRRRKQCMYENCKNKTCSGGYNRIHCYARRRDNPDLRDIIIEKHCKYCKSLGLAGNDCKGRGGIQYCPISK